MTLRPMTPSVTTRLFLMTTPLCVPVYRRGAVGGLDSDGQASRPGPSRTLAVRGPRGLVRPGCRLVLDTTTCATDFVRLAMPLSVLQRFEPCHRRCRRTRRVFSRRAARAVTNRPRHGITRSFGLAPGLT